MTETRICIDCNEPYEAFVFPDGSLAGSGRCPACRETHLRPPNIANAVNRVNAANTRKPGESWGVVQLCKCERPYEATWYMNKFGREVDISHGLCPECRVKEQVEREAREQADRDRLIREKREEWRRSCGIPPTYQGERFTTWKKGRPGNVDKIYAICREYAENYPLLTPQGYRSLVLTSPRVWGLGKTHLVCSIAHRILDRWNGEEIRCPVYVTTEPDLMTRIRATYNRVFYTGDGAPPRQETEEGVLKHVTWVPLLILDDVGKEDVDNPKFVQRMLFRIINGRYNNNKLPVVITANMSEREFRQHLGGENEASLSRLYESCGGKFYELTGKDIRGGESGGTHGK